MLSHHAPTRRLLQNFLQASTESPRPCLWVYRKTTRARKIYKITSESAEQGYFRNSPDQRSEESIETDLNEQYEIPFHGLLPHLTGEIAIVLDSEMRNVCARYAANMFLRSRPYRAAIKAHQAKFQAGIEDRLSDVGFLWQYAAALSFRLGRPIGVTELKEAIKNIGEQEAQQEEFSLGLLRLGSVDCQAN